MPNMQGTKVQHRYGGTLKLFVDNFEVDSRRYSCPVNRTEIFIKYNAFAKNKDAYILLIPNTE